MSPFALIHHDSVVTLALSGAGPAILALLVLLSVLPRQRSGWQRPLRWLQRLTTTARVGSGRSSDLKLSAPRPRALIPALAASSLLVVFGACSTRGRVDKDDRIPDEMTEVPDEVAEVPVLGEPGSPIWFESSTAIKIWRHKAQFYANSPWDYSCITSVEFSSSELDSSQQEALADIRLLPPDRRVVVFDGANDIEVLVLDADGTSRRYDESPWESDDPVLPRADVLVELLQSERASKECSGGSAYDGTGATGTALGGSAGADQAGSAGMGGLT